MIIGVDVDGVLRNFREGFERYFNLYYPQYELPEDFFYSYDIYAKLPSNTRLVMEALLPVILETSEPYIEADYFLNVLRNFGEVRIITSNRGGNKAITETWLYKHKFFDEIPNILSYYPKALCKEIDILIDDNPFEIEEFQKTGRSALLISREWNQGIYGYKGIVDRIKEMSFEEKYREITG